MLAARPATEIITSHNDLCLPVGFTIQDKIRFFCPVLGEPHLVKQIVPETRSLDRLQELLGDDHIGIDIDDVHRRGNASQSVKFLHLSTSLSFAYRGYRSDTRSMLRPLPFQD